ncbi:hypothetical protein M422DRAFT_262561 [Sphaerobolus stellatus SS14]|uniref:Unplaced genomic scaffold SPHSTscaffold_116, whole genome shotgun sequence n=1 Tax=Sphaerobolus stellatus (strain SS14) TaxID=990650 RepID=A0A0C9VCT6_SPHS4|nr:hypothetical protein M422DRAFT_262561 [Sphaerobolus stellatus SS14]
MEILKKMQAEEVMEATSVGGNQIPIAQSGRLTVSVGINMGLELELKQQNVRAKLAERQNPTTKQGLELEETGCKMTKVLEAWYLNLADFLPAEALDEELRTDATPERQKLRLPSDFNRLSHTRLRLNGLAEKAFSIRRGQANDAIKKLRDCLGSKSFLVRRKYKMAGGQGMLLRSESEIQWAQKQVQKWAEVYCRAWQAMGRLRDLGDDGGTSLSNGNHGRGKLQQLTDSDLVMLSEWMDEHRLWREKGEIAEAEASKKGKGRRELPWLWKLEIEVTTNMVGHDQVVDAVDKWTTEAIRIEWLHAQASMERFDEEVRLLEAESGRIPRMFAYLEDRWKTRAVKWGKEGEDTGEQGHMMLSRSRRGAIAYARRSAMGFRQLKIQADIR